MSSIQERLQLKRVPLDTWNVREQLCLASAVVRSGDQNWMSVSRALKTTGESNRPPDWYSQKSCAAQYGALLENVETPKRKKRNSEGAVETPQECILKQLTEQRILEIQKNINEMNQQYETIKNEIAEVRNTSTSDDRVQEIWMEIETVKRTRERENARRAAWLREREEKRNKCERNWRPPAPTTPTSPIVTSSTPSSPLLTSLLKSSPVVTTPQRIPHPANVYVDAVSPSAGAPTLSLLLEQPHAENKHAAIEHIKSQLVQIEHQLKANTQNRSVSLAGTVDIDDIEIKAEDVYAFKDIDIHIPPVAAMHKGSPREKPVKKEEDDMNMSVASDVTREEHEVTAPASEEVPAAETPTTEETEMVDVQQQIREPAQVEEIPPPTEQPVTPPVEKEPEVKIAFPEVKFPTPEIKVIQPESSKIKEEIQQMKPDIVLEEKPAEGDSDSPVIEESEKEKEVEEKVVEEIPPEVETKKESQVTEEKAEEAVVEESNPVSVEPETATLTEEQIQEILPEDIPLPPEESKSEIQEPEKETTPAPEVKEEAKEVPEIKEEVTQEEDRKDDDVEDSIPLKEMIREESAATLPDVDVRVKQEYDTHTETDDDTPMELSREEEKDGKKRRDYSRKKKPDSRTCSGSESAPESPSSSDAERQHRLWKKSVMLVYSRLCAHKYASLFLRPISDEEAPGYSSIIKRPMDLSTIKKNIDAGNVRTTAEFQRDVLLMLSNALIYNNSTHSVYTMAKDMFEDAQCQLDMLLAAQAHAGLVSAPPTRKRRPHTHTPHAHKTHRV